MIVRRRIIVAFAYSAGALLWMKFFFLAPLAEEAASMVGAEIVVTFYIQESCSEPLSTAWKTTWSNWNHWYTVCPSKTRCICWRSLCCFYVRRWGFPKSQKDCKICWTVICFLYCQWRIAVGKPIAHSMGCYLCLDPFMVWPSHLFPQTKQWTSWSAIAGLHQASTSPPIECNTSPSLTRFCDHTVYYRILDTGPNIATLRSRVANSALASASHPWQYNRLVCWCRCRHVIGSQNTFIFQQKGRGS